MAPLKKSTKSPSRKPATAPKKHRKRSETFSVYIYRVLK
jgi:hypothetical protein